MFRRWLTLIAAVFALAPAGCVRHMFAPPSPVKAGYDPAELVDPVGECLCDHNVDMRALFALAERIRQERRPAVIPPPKNVLVLSGGGVYGSYCAGVLVGWTEADVCIGDLFRLGSALVELSQARQPCWKLNLRFGLPDMARRVQDSGRTGWYLRVLVPGSVAAGDRMTLTARPNPGWDLARVQRLLYRDAVDREALAEFAGLAGLSASWRALAMRRLESGAFEDWAPRLSG